MYYKKASDLGVKEAYINTANAYYDFNNTEAFKYYQLVEKENIDDDLLFFDQASVIFMVKE